MRNQSLKSKGNGFNAATALFENQISEDTSENQINVQEFMTTEEAAEYLRISTGRLRNLTSDGHVIHYKLGRSNRYRKSDLRNLLLGQKRGM